jgi:polysaccharide biosynthesis protein PslG
MKVRLLTVMALIAATLALWPGGAEARRSVPRGFIGMNADGPLLAPPVNLGSQLGTMVGAGVESIRAAFYWAAAQPFPNFDAVPADQRGLYENVGGVPTDFSASDRIVRAAAARRLSVLPTILWAPGWDALGAVQFAAPPADPAPYAAYVAALAARYGPNGSFWAANPGLPKLPIRDWQIWNEPSFTQFWDAQPFAVGYVNLLRASRTALRQVDPRARVVLAGFPGKSWIALRQVYAAGGRGLFDVVAVHPFTFLVGDVLKILQIDRGVMKRHGDARVPLMVTETGWPSAAGKIRKGFTFGYEVSRRGQAARAHEALLAFARRRRQLRIERIYWYTWLTADRDRTYPFDWAGLETISGGRITKKPAYATFRSTALKLEGRR